MKKKRQVESPVTKEQRHREAREHRAVAKLLKADPQCPKGGITSLSDYELTQYETAVMRARFVLGY